MAIETKKTVSPRVANAATEFLASKGYVAVIDIFTSLGWLTKDNIAAWKSGKISCLEHVVTVDNTKISEVMREIREWGKLNQLKPVPTAYKNNSRLLRFSRGGNPHIEKVYRTHYVPSTEEETGDADVLSKNSDKNKANIV